MKRVWKKVVIALLTGIIAVGLLAYSKRHTIIIWHLQKNNETQEMVIIEMLENAKPIIERELKMTFHKKSTAGLQVTEVKKRDKEMPLQISEHSSS